MTKEDKVKIIKWYISQYCGFGSIQTQINDTEDINILEIMVMNDRSYCHYSKCSTCWYNNDNRNDINNCIECNKTQDKGNYTFPYGCWRKFYKKESKQS